MTRDEFFTWCADRGLTDNTPIAAVFRVSSQTIRNWRRKDGKEALPAWVPLACDGCDVALRAGQPPALPSLTLEWLRKWQNRHGLKTYEDTGDVFNIKRQAVHNWYRRGRFPKWLVLACVGYDTRIRSKGQIAA